MAHLMKRALPSFTIPFWTAACALALAGLGESSAHAQPAAKGPQPGETPPPVISAAQWFNGDGKLLSDYRNAKVLLLWFFCQ